MPCHPDRVRRNYECPECDGTGKVDDVCGSGWYHCSECDGAGIVLVAKARPAPRPLTEGERMIVELCNQELLRNLKNHLLGAKLVSRDYRE